MAKKKVAMVQPPPSRVIARSEATKQSPPKQAAFQGSDPGLENILRTLGNDRSYSILSSDFHAWTVHFEGDTHHSIVKWSDGKWIITKER